jgi:hypothetical protein
MKHLTDSELLLAADGELGRSHLESCSDCRARLQTLERALDDYRHALTVVPTRRSSLHRYWVAGAAAAMLVIAFAIQRLPRAQNGPDARLTPGAVREEFQISCSGSEADLPVVAAPVAGEVFRRYGIAKPRPGDYEVDYLIPPDLGGTADVANLWPQPYTRGVWNSRVKDALEDRLKARVCSGQMSLADAQSDLRHGWVDAYKRHFQTQQPLYEHAGFVKDRAWE